LKLKQNKPVSNVAFNINLRLYTKGVDHAAALADPSAGTLAETKAAMLNTIFKIVPMENVNGRTKVEAGRAWPYTGYLFSLPLSRLTPLVAACPRIQ